MVIKCVHVVDAEKKDVSTFKAKEHSDAPKKRMARGAKSLSQSFASMMINYVLVFGSERRSDRHSRLRRIFKITMQGQIRDEFLIKNNFENDCVMYKIVWVV